ncbi:WD repeat-containing protein 62, partial [Biomphalaria pfeifferi]
NCLSAECLKIVYTDQGEQVKKTNDRVKWRKKTRPATSSGVKKIGKQCFTVLAVCPNGIDIATGNRHGRITVYDANTMKVKVTILAHEAELTAMKYSSSHRYKVLASGSRDRMIHVMDASKHYQLLTTLDDHSSTITSINFTHISRCLMLVSSSLDKSVLVRAYLDSSILSFKPVRAIVEKKSVMDFTIHPWSGLLALACQDKQVRVYGMLSSIEDNSFRGCPKCGGQLIKIQIDPSGQYLLTACSNKTVNLIQFSNGNMISTINGHAESITSISFSHNMKHVITSAVDGCIFLWRLPQFVTYVVRKEMAEMGRLTKGMVLSDRWKKSKLREDNYSLKENEAMRTYHESLPRQPSSSSGQVQTNNTDHIETKQCQQINNQSGDTSFSNKYKPAEGAEVKPPLELQSKVVATSESWLNACDERRRKFKLEAQSIHKILAMMRLVTEAMEKDLANADWIMSQPDSSLNPCPENEFPPNHDTAPTPEEKHQPQEQPQQLPKDGIFEMIFAKSLPNCNNWQVNAHAPKVVQLRPGSSQGEGHDTPQEEGSEGGSSVYEKIQHDWSTYHMYKQENKSFSNSLMSKPLDHVTIKLTRDSNVYHCVGTFAFFNELDGYNYSSAVNHISQAMENKQRTNRSMVINSANDNNPIANRSTTINSSVPNSPMADRSMVIQSIVPNPQMANRSMVINSSVPNTQMPNRALVVNSAENKQMANRAMVIKSALKSKQMANRSITTNSAMESKPIANRSMVINTDSNTKIRTNNAVVIRSEMISKQKIRCDAEVCCERENRGSNDFNKNNIVLKTFTESMLSPLEADVLDNRLTFHSAQLEQKAPKAICNLSLALANPQGLGDFGFSGGVLRFSGQCASFTQNVAGKTAVCETANAQVCCTLRVDAVGHNAQCSQESSESVIIDLGISFKAFIEELGQREGMATPPHAMLTKDKMPELTSETSETVVTSSREHRLLRHKGKKLRSGTSGDTESMRSSDSANRYPISGHNVGHSLVSGGHSLVSGGHNLVSGCGQGDGDVGQSITLEKLLLKPDTVLFEFANMKEA